MTNKERKQIIFDSTWGTPELRGQKIQEALPSLQRDLERLRHDGAQQCEEYKRHLQAWLCQRVNGVTKPRAILSDLRLAHLAKGIAYLLTAGELVLAFFLGILFGTNPGLLLLLALVAVVAPKSLLVIWHNEAQPQLTRKRLQNWVLIPSLLTVIVAINLLFLARSVMGALALLLLPFFSGAFYLLALGAIGLSSGLFAMAFLLSWSKHAEKKFKATEQEALATDRTRRQVQEIEKEMRAMEEDKRPMPQASPTTLPAAQQEYGLVAPLPKRSHSHVSRSLVSLLLLGALWCGGCDGQGDKSRVIAATPAPANQAEAPATSLDVYVDWSLSAAAQPLSQAAQAILAALPAIAEKYRVSRLVIHQFGRSGWDAVEVTRLDLPVWQPGTANELGEIFGQVKGAQAQQAQAHYHEKLQAALQALTPASFLPPADFPEPPCTDLSGLFRRLAAARRAQPVINIVVTDGHDTCQQALAQVRELTAATVVVLLPEHERNAEPTPSDMQFKLRQEAIAQALPNVVIEPYFGDIGVAVEKASAHQPRQQK